MTHLYEKHLDFFMSQSISTGSEKPQKGPSLATLWRKEYDYSVKVEYFYFAKKENYPNALLVEITAQARNTSIPFYKWFTIPIQPARITWSALVEDGYEWPQT
jgi:hypothetical protein